jgi:hypothetical protein
MAVGGEVAQLVRANVHHVPLASALPRRARGQQPGEVLGKIVSTSMRIGRRCRRRGSIRPGGGSTTATRRARSTSTTIGARPGPASRADDPHRAVPCTADVLRGKAHDADDAAKGRRRRRFTPSGPMTSVIELALARRQATVGVGLDAAADPGCRSFNESMPSRRQEVALVATVSRIRNDSRRPDARCAADRSPGWSGSGGRVEGFDPCQAANAVPAEGVFRRAWAGRRDSAVGSCVTRLLGLGDRGRPCSSAQRAAALTSGGWTLPYGLRR